jgi:DNA-binding NtrC family response regulator
MKCNQSKGGESFMKSASTNCQTRTVVVVEDDPENRDVMEMAIGMEGFNVRLASDHAEALEVLASTDPSVVLLDYYGVGENVRDFITHARFLHPRVPIVLVTGAKNPAQKARTLGLKEFLAKPFSSQDLHALLTKHCARHLRRAAPSQLAFNLF